MLLGDRLFRRYLPKCLEHTGFKRRSGTLRSFSFFQAGVSGRYHTFETHALHEHRYVFAAYLREQVKNLSVVSTNASLLTGCRFCGKDKTLVAVAAYDSRFLAVLPAPKLS
jgi:hypothetical protein